MKIKVSKSKWNVTFFVFHLKQKLLSSRGRKGKRRYCDNHGFQGFVCFLYRVIARLFLSFEHGNKINTYKFCDSADWFVFFF